jgi:putative redox protein
MTIVTVRNIRGYQQEIIAGDHVMFADEPVEIGGDDTGPNPYELLLGALGACKAITVRMYAQRKGWDLQSVEVELQHSKDYAKDCESCPDQDVKLDRIMVKTTFTGNLDDTQRRRLKEIAGRCPVHQTLTGRVEITDVGA